MNFRKLLQILLGVLILLALVIGLTSIRHPIILKWVIGAAKHHGKPMPATVFINGHVNDQIKVFYTDEEDNYLVSLAAYDSLGALKFININLNEKWIGRPVAVSKDDYDFIGSDLFQSEAGSHFSPIQDNMNGSNFDPQLTFTNGQIRFKMPPNKMQFDSVRIVLP